MINLTDLELILIFLICNTLLLDVYMGHNRACCPGCPSPQTENSDVSLVAGIADTSAVDRPSICYNDSTSQPIVFYMWPTDDSSS